MRRSLASLLVILMTFALVARGVAAPLIHLHQDVPAPAAASSISHHAHADGDCNGTHLSDAADVAGCAGAHTDVGHAKDKNAPIKHNSVCAANGACCGSLALSETFRGALGLDALLEPAQTIVRAGVKPTNPDRPPSPRLA